LRRRECSLSEPLLFAFGVDVDARVENEFNVWYSNEHLPLVASCPGVISAKRYSVESAGRRPREINRYWAIYEVATREVMSSPEMLAIAEQGFGRFAEYVHTVRRYWFTPIETSPDAMTEVEVSSTS
jgi:hypothetical protein